MKQMLLGAGLLVSFIASAQSWETGRYNAFRPLGTPDAETQPDRLPPAAGPDIDIRGYRFRGDPISPGEAWQTPDRQEIYRFRPLSEQEKARLEQTPERRDR